MRKFFKKLRVGMAAGNKDLKILGDQEGKNDGVLNDIPKFTPFNCNFFKQTVSASAQADKLLQKSVSKDAPRLTTDKVHPIYDKARHKSYINKTPDKKFLNQYKTASTQVLLTELKDSSAQLQYPGDKEKTEQEHENERVTIVKEMLLKKIEEKKNEKERQEAADELLQLNQQMLRMVY